MLFAGTQFKEQWFLYISPALILMFSKIRYPLYRPTWPRGVQEVKAPRFLDNQYMKVVRLLPPGISWYSFLEAESTPGT